MWEVMQLTYRSSQLDPHHLYLWNEMKSDVCKNRTQIPHKFLSELFFF